MEEGAVFTNAHLDHYPSVTAVGHSAMLTGAPPSISGIIGNDWYDRSAKRNVHERRGPRPQRLGRRRGDRLLAAPPEGQHRRGRAQDGPPRLPGRQPLVQGPQRHPHGRADGRPRAVVGRRDRGASSPAPGTRRRCPTGSRPSTSPGPPRRGWARSGAAVSEDGSPGPLLRPCRRHAGPGVLRPGLYNSAFGNDLLVSLAEKALGSEGLGTRAATDILAVSFSCNDAVGHGKGPHSPEVHAITVATDRAIGRLLEAIDRQVGLARTLVVLTADHGVAPVPEQMQEWKMPGGRFSREALETAATHGPRGGVRARRVAGGPGRERPLPEPGPHRRGRASTPPPWSASWPRPSRACLRPGAPTPGPSFSRGACPPDPWSRAGPRVLRPRALRRRRGAPRALLDVGLLGDDPRHAVLLRHPHPADPDGARGSAPAGTTAASCSTTWRPPSPPSSESRPRAGRAGACSRRRSCPEAPWPVHAPLPAGRGSTARALRVLSIPRKQDTTRPPGPAPGAGSLSSGRRSPAPSPVPGPMTAG